jgi:hypothetical protein
VAPEDKDLLLKIPVTAITGKGAEASKDVFTGLAGTISLVSIRSIHQVFDFGIVTPLFIRCQEFY